MRVPALSAPALGAVAVLAAVAGVVEAVVRAGLSGWVPVSDNAAIALRTQDVFSRHPPLLGMPSTLGSYVHGHPASHLGPLEFFALAPTYALSGRSPAGLLAGVLLVNGASVLAIAWASYRLGGIRVLAFAMALVAFLTWSLGPNVADIWNPNIALLPFAALLMLAVAVGNRVLVALPWALLFGSFALQAHLSYLGLVGIVMALTVALAVVHGRRELGEASDDARRSVFTRLRRITLWSLVVIAFCWWAPLLQQFTSRNGNLSAVASGFSASSRAAGGAFGVHYVGLVAGLPPPFGKAPSAISGVYAGHVTVLDGLRFLLPWSIAAAGIAFAWRRRAFGALTTFATGAVVLFAITLTAIRTPLLIDNVAYVYNVRWLWPSAAVFWFTAGFGAWQLFRRNESNASNASGDRMCTDRLTAAFCVATLVLALWPRAAALTVDQTDARLTSRLASQVVPAVPAHGPYVLRGLGLVASMTVVPGLAVALERHGVATYIEPEPKLPISPWGAHRLYSNQPVTGTIWVVSGGTGKVPTVTAKQIATADGATTALRQEVARLRVTILRTVGTNGVRLTTAGARVVAHGSRYPQSAAQLAAAVSDPARALDDGTLGRLAGAHLVAVPHPARAAIGRYDDLRPLVTGRWDATVFLDGPSPVHAVGHDQ